MGEAFLSRVVTADETWVHHFELETERSGQEEVPTGHARTLVYRWRKAVEVNGDFVEK
jgi:hypothetical protein